MRWLNWLHVLLSIIPLWLLTVALLTDARNFASTANKSFEAMQQSQNAMAAIVLLFLLAQLFFLTHILMGIFRKKKNQL
ncbi:MAG: hypothetical protein LCH58_06495 [Bacteroidetes bacterium]|uniref:hypothetical protein n=1 Tax=Phnomibacter sp. TaxID=2836217 RepID=UPI002FDD2DCE|nr:hypothetical protein [Bacteroidota bacterium]